MVSPSNIKENMTYTVSCNAVANPAVRAYYISSPTGVFKTSSGIYNFTAQNCSLNSGIYSCKAENSQGNGTAVSKQVDIDGKSLHLC